MSSLTLYYAPGSCALVPHALLNHLSLPFTTVLVKPGPDGLAPADGSLTPAQYRATIHHAGYVPALKLDDGEVITEMPAILSYIALLSSGTEDGSALLGKSSLEQARVSEWLAWLSGTLHGNGDMVLLGLFTHLLGYR